MSGRVKSVGAGQTLLAAVWAEFAAGTILLIMRIYVNAFIVRRWGADFYWALLAYILAVLATAFTTIAVEFSLGEHLNELLANHPNYIAINQFWQWAATTCLVLAIAVGKLAIIAFILQIEGNSTKPKRKWILYVFGILNVLINIIIVPIIWTQCAPTSKLWNEELPGNCAGRARNQKYAYFQGSFGGILDLTLAIYPVLIFWSLQLKLNVKIGLIFLFGFGIVAAVCAAIKTVSLSTITASDVTFELASLDLWAATEMWIVFIVSCIPTVRPIFVKAINKVASSQDRTFPTNRGYAAQNESINGIRVDAYSSNKKTANSNIKSIVTNNDSEENILPGQDGIRMTTDIRIQYQEDRSNSFANKKRSSSQQWETQYDDRV